MSESEVMLRVQGALGRTEPLSAPPIPPEIDEPITRLVHSDIGLPALFETMAKNNVMGVQRGRPEEIARLIVEFLISKSIKTVAMPVSTLLDKLKITEALQAAGISFKRWPDMTLDELYDYDCGLTDVDYAVAETGSLVVRAAVGHGRAISLVPMIHVAVVEPKNIVPDLVDLFEMVTRQGTGSAMTLITGPSKTSDIEMNLVVGVHGPMTVQVFLLE
jgi:L-lactate dehydrogenase complex protein LldG